MTARTLGACLEAAAATLKNSPTLNLSRAQSHREARYLAAAILRREGFRPAEIHKDADMSALLRAPSISMLHIEVPVVAEKLFTEVTARRARAEPLAYILGETEFWSMSFSVDESCLIPRPDTETLVEAMVDHCFSQLVQDGQTGRVADLYTGAGPILLAALSELPSDVIGVGFDINDRALRFAQENATRHNLDSRATFCKQDLSLPLPICFPHPFSNGSASNSHDDLDCQWDIAFANPPYIKSEDIDSLMSDVRDYEPSLALDGGPDGLDPYRHIASALSQGRLRTRWLIMEIGHDQASMVEDIFLGCDNSVFDPMSIVEVRKDLSGRDRCVVMRDPNFEGGVR